MAERFEYKGYQVAFEVMQAREDQGSEWHGTVYIRQDEDSATGSFTVSPHDKTAVEARARAMRIAKCVIDESQAGQE